MGKYDNFFSTDNPLSLGSNSLSQWQKPAFMLQQDAAIQQQEDEELKKQQEAAKKLQAARLQRDRAQAFVDNLSKTGFNATKAQQAADRQVAFARNPETGELEHSSFSNSLLIDNLKKQQEEFQKYTKLYDDVNDIGKAILNNNPEEDNRDDEYVNKFKSLIKDDVINRGFATEKDFESMWQDTSQNDRMAVALGAIGRKYFKGEDLKEFEQADDQHRFDMLASYIRNNPNYESLASKHKEVLDWGDNFFSKDWKAATDRATNRFLYGITGGDGWNPFTTFADVVGGGVISAVGNLGNLAGSLIGSAGEYIQSRIEGMGFEEEVDDYVAKRADAYIDKKAEALYENIMANSSDDEKSEIVNQFDILSSQLSNEYKAEMGSSLTEIDDSTKIKEYTKLLATSQIYGEEAANKGLQEFWTNTIAGKQTHGDKLLRTAGTFGNTIVADAAAFAGVIANPLFMPVDHHDSYNPEDWEVDGEGYTDALVKRNPILTWATNLQETGSWSADSQKKYKDLGVNALQIYKDIDEQNSFLSGNDFYDIVGQYGFTAATTALSMGGSAAVKSLASGIARNATREGISGSLARGLARGIAGKEARQALKAGLANGATEAEITAAKEAAAKVASQAMYKGNLTVGAMMGTAEGALEAKSTYNTFLEENLKRLEEQFQPYQEMLKDNARVRDYMLSSGYTPSVFTRDADSNRMEADFSPEQYAKARKELQDVINDKMNAAKARIEDNAADAAAVNFLSNSCINGFLNVFAKEAIMSRDVKEAARIAQNKNKFKDLVDVVKRGDSWEAVIKKAVTDNGKRSVWKAAKDISGKTLKNAGGEFLEEYGQNISDKAAREALQYDLNQYLGTIYDKDAREAFQSDWAGMLNAGLNSILTNATDQENLKAGVFGALSSMLGGFSPAGILSTVSGFTQGRTEQDKGIWGTAKWIGRNLSNLYQGGIQQAIRDNNEEYQTAKRLVESTNAWLNTAKNQELITHMGGAIGFKKALEDAITAGDAFTAHDSKLGLSIENAYMLQALKDTDYGKALQEKISQNADLLEVAENKNGEFDENGNYIGNMVANNDGSIGAQEDWVSTAINTFKNQLGDDSRSTNLTDQQIVERIGKNAQEFIQLQNEVIKAQQRVQNIFKNDNLDPLAEQAFVYALMTQQNARSRRDGLSTRLHNSTHGDTLTEQEKEALKESGLDQTAIDFLIEHGTLEKAEKEYENIQKQINQAHEQQQNKKASTEEKRQAKNRQKQLTQEARRLARQIAIEKDRRESEEPSLNTEDSEGKEIALTASAKTTFSEGDIANMSDSQKAEVIANKEKFSKEQQDIIDNFLSISRRNLAEQENDVALSNEEVAKDYIDLSTLQRKANAYDKHLTEYINNPDFLSTTAAHFREKERTRTLRHLYKDDLQMREGESVLDFKERLDTKIQDLKDSGKMEDARILEKLKSENDAVSKVDKNLKDVVLAKAIYALLKGDGTDSILRTQEFGQMEKALQIVISESGMSMEEIKDVLDKSDTSTIVDLMTRKLSDGQYSLNKALVKEGLTSFNLTQDAQHNEQVLAPTLQKMKEFVDFYISKKQGQKKGRVSTEPKVTQQQESQPPSREAAIPQPKNNEGQGQRREDRNLVIKAPGSVDKNSPLGQFLRRRGVSLNVRNIDNVKNPNVFFAVISDYGSPEVFAVQAIPPGEAVSGKTVNINGTDYKIIGVLDLQQSTTMAELGKTAFNGLLPEEYGKLLISDNGPVIAQFSSIKDAKSVSEQNQEDAVPIKDLLNNDDASIRAWVAELMLTGKKTTVENPNGDKSTTLRDSYGHPVQLSKNMEASDDAGKFPIGNSTLEEILGNLNLDDSKSVQDTITALKQNEFFQAYFDSWRNFDPLSIRDAKTNKTTYEQLIGDFFFLGYPYVKVGDDGIQILDEREEYLNPRIEGGKLIIDSFDKTDSYGKKRSFEFQLPIGNVDKQLLALQALKKIAEVAPEYFSKYKPQMNMNIIGNPKASSTQKIKESTILVGLIKAGILSGYSPESIDRKMEVLNPFASKSTAEKNNNPNASQFDPAKRGTTDGGRVNVEDGTVEEGQPKTPRQRIFDNLTAEQKKAQDIVDRIVQRSTQVTQEDSNADSYQGREGTSAEGVTFARATSAKQAMIGADTEPFDASEDVGDISHAYGNTVDAVVRAALEVLNIVASEGKTIDKKQLLERILKDKAFAGHDHIPNWSDYQIGKFLNQLIAFHQAITVQKGWTIVPKDVRAFGMADVLNGGTKVGRLPVAGTLDLLAYDREGNFHIIDIKTKHLTDDGESALEQSRAEWEAQVSTYQEMLHQQNPDMNFGENYIFPVFLSYSMPNGVAVEVADDKMTVTNYTPSKEPVLKANTNKEHLTIDDFLFKLNTLEFKGYEESRLGESDKKKILPVTSESGPVLGSAEQPSKASSPQAEIGGSIGDILDAINPFESRRTTRQARFTEFINNHIAPVAKVKIGIVSRAVSKIKDLIGNGGKDIILRKELANIFFNGDTAKLDLVLRGEVISEDNLQAVIQKLKTYYNSYIQNSDKYIANITKRHNISKAVYSYLKGDITQNQLEEELNKYKVSIGDVVELAEYMSAPDKQKAASEIIKKLETSKVISEKKYGEDLKALNTTMESMQAKLDFLNSSSSYRMLKDRVTSVQDAINANQYEEQLYRKNASLDELLEKKAGSYGATKLLRGISLRTKNGNFKKLATILLRQIKEKQLTIPITIEDQSLNFVEGSTKGKAITIQKSSLDSYEHFERVLLHEMLHAVIEASPEMRNTLQALLDQTIINIQKTSGKTVEQIKEDYYGLSNVDEFISEFFTNYAFQETLKTVGSNEYSNIFDKFIGTIKEKIFGEKSLYSQISRTMEEVLESTNIENTHRATETQELYSRDNGLKSLSKEMQEAILSRGISMKEYNNMTNAEKEQLQKCCK